MNSHKINFHGEIRKKIKKHPYFLVENESYLILCKIFLLIQKCGCFLFLQKNIFVCAH